jgi:hypothetical protein
MFTLFGGQYPDKSDKTSPPLRLPASHRWWYWQHSAHAIRDPYLLKTDLTPRNHRLMWQKRAGGRIGVVFS